MILPAPTLDAALRWGVNELAGVSETAQLDAAVLLRKAGGFSEVDLIVLARHRLPESVRRSYRELVLARRGGQPVAYLTGRREFWSLELTVTPEVLIPRPETELLVQTALGLIPDDADWQVADLGTGSGAIALALASERPLCRVVATDLSSAALRIAEVNRSELGLPNVDLVQGDWLAPLDGRRLSLLVSNPPYIALDDPHLGLGDVRFEPSMALTAGADGLDSICCIVAQAGSCLEPGGWLLLEHGLNQGHMVGNLLRQMGFAQLKLLYDLAGLPRATLGCLPS